MQSNAFCNLDPTCSAGVYSLQIAIASFLVVLLSACTTNYGEVTPPLPSQAEAPQYYQHSIEASYRVRVGDKLTIQSYYDQQLGQSQVVRPDGRISLILIGDIVAANKTSSELASEIKTAYAQILGDPDINVVVDELAPRRIYISGEVRVPAAHTIEDSLTLMQAITLSGGLHDTANINQVLLLRNEGNNLKVHQIDADKILASEIPDVYLSQNDVLFVPRTKIADVGIFVDQYINSIVPDFIRVNFNFNNQIGTVKTEQDTLLVNPP